MTDTLLENLKSDLHNLWARLDAEGHALAGDAQRLYERVLHATEPVVVSGAEKVATTAEAVAVNVGETAVQAATEEPAK